MTPFIGRFTYISFISRVNSNNNLTIVKADKTKAIVIINKNNNLTTVKADKAKAIVIINKEKLKEKVNNFITENHMEQLNKDPTEAYQKQIHQTIQKCNRLMDKYVHK